MRPSNQIRTAHRQTGFTLLEIMITIAIIATIAIILLVMLNPQAQLLKVQDAQRKRDLNQMSKIFEEYYSNSENYPVSSDVCIDDPVSNNGVCSCHVCGLSSSSSQLASYTSKLFCDPAYPRKKYLYQYDCSDTPTWYRVCTSLDNPSQQITQGYNYGVASTNTTTDTCFEYVLDITPLPSGPSNPVPTTIPPTSIPTTIPTITPYLSPTPYPTGMPMPTCIPDPGAKWCLKSGCNNCGTFDECRAISKCDNPLRLFYATCTVECREP